MITADAWALLARLVRAAAANGSTAVDPRPWIPDWNGGPIHLAMRAVEDLEVVTMRRLPKIAGDERLLQYGLEILDACDKVRTLLGGQARRAH